MLDNPQPMIWPSTEGAQSVLSRFYTVPEQERRQKMLDQEIFARMRIVKAQEKLKKLRDENTKVEMNLHMSQYFFNARNIFNNANVIDLNDISHMTNQNLEKTKKKITTRHAQMGTPDLENGRKIKTRGKQALVNHDLGSETNVAVMKNLNRSMVITNGGGRDAVPTLEDACLKWSA